MKRRDWDEDDVKVRPGRSTRPRSKVRPDFSEAIPARVIAVDRGRFTCLAGDSLVMAVRARHLGRKGLVVGDRVGIDGPLPDNDDTLVRIVRRDPRRTELRRTADDTDPTERVIVANADQMGIVSSLADPEPSYGFIDRCLVAAYDAGIEPLLILTKGDLATPDEVVARYPGSGFPTIPVRRLADRSLSYDGLTEKLSGRTTVLVGQSGVGKSTLVNALVPEADRAVGSVNEVTGRGRHTSTSAYGFPFDGGLLIDTPGVRSFGLAHVDVHRVIHAFPDLEPGTAECPRGCTHDEPDCGLDQFAADHGVEPARVASMRRLLASMRDQ
ncbi:MAG: ribosome small subunit-dependent GTPase A [Candidatus Nanopelagicales bacterium]|nr:ribosome small subunit-dependent GTPase A [Candidatus Nanopelagicales bacterium]MCU0298864.1 ribosome small subunit-dependent GTPase A [Candidatus Nanopelagicales bacterium]